MGSRRWFGSVRPAASPAWNQATTATGTAALHRTATTAGRARSGDAVTYPAWFDIHKDPEISRRPTALRVYANLVSRTAIFYVPQEIKTWKLADDLGADKGEVIAALNLLAKLGYIVEHGRGSKRERIITVTLDRSAKPTHQTG